MNDDSHLEGEKTPPLLKLARYHKLHFPFSILGKDGMSTFEMAREVCYHSFKINLNGCSRSYNLTICTDSLRISNLVT